LGIEAHVVRTPLLFSYQLPADEYTVILTLQDEVFGSAYAAAVYLSSVLNFPKDKRVYVIGMSGLEDELRSEGISFIGGTVSRTSSLPSSIIRHPSTRISFSDAGSRGQHTLCARRNTTRSLSWRRAYRS